MKRQNSLPPGHPPSPKNKAALDAVMEEVNVRRDGVRDELESALGMHKSEVDFFTEVVRPSGTPRGSFFVGTIDGAQYAVTVMEAKPPE